MRGIAPRQALLRPSAERPRRKDFLQMLMQTHKARLDALRTELDKRGLHGFVIPISDEHMSE